MEGVIACAALLGMKGAVKISLSDTGLCVKGASRLENKLCMKAKQQEKTKQTNKTLGFLLFNLQPSGVEKSFLPLGWKSTMT